MIAAARQNRVMHNLGTWLQLFGNIIMLGGAFWVWHKASGRLNQWRAAIGTRLNQLRTTISDLRTAPPPPAISGHLTAHAQLSADVTLKRSGTDDERITQLENDHNTVLNLLAQLESRLRNEINQATADVLGEFQTLSNAVRLRDIYPVLVGITVSIAGYLCQLFG